MPKSTGIWKLSRAGANARKTARTAVTIKKGERQVVKEGLWSQSRSMNTVSRAPSQTGVGG